MVDMGALCFAIGFSVSLFDVEVKVEASGQMRGPRAFV